MIDTETVPGSMEEADAALTTVTPDEPAPAVAAPEPGQPRDEQGRFAEKAPQDATPAEAEPAPSASPETPSEPVAEAETEPTVEETPDEPFVYRADGQEIAIPGSAVGEDGVFIPKQSLPELTQLLAEGRSWRTTARQRLSEAAQQVRAADERTKAAEAQAQHVLGHIEGLIESGQISEWLQNVQQSWAILKADAKVKATEMQFAAERERLKTYEEREQQAKLRPMMDQALSTSVRQFGAEVGLDEVAIHAVVEQLRHPDFESVLFVKAPYDDPGAGIRQGELVINYNVVRQAINLARLGKQNAAPLAKIEAAKAQNAAQQPKAKVPPTVGRGAQAPRKTMPVPKTAQEADDMLLNGDLSWADEVA